MNEDIRNNILSRNDSDLIDLIVNKSDYTPEAIQIAEEEIKRRNIDPSFYHSKFEELSKISNKRKKAEEDLSTKEKVLLVFSFFSPLLLPFVWYEKISPMPSARSFLKHGYNKKFSRTVNYKLFSFFFWVFFLLICWLIYDSYRAEQRYIEFIKNQQANQSLNRTKICWCSK